MTNLMGWSICGRGWKSGFVRPGTQDRSLFREYDSYKELPDAGCISAACASDRIPGLLKNSIARMAVNGNEK